MRKFFSKVKSLKMYFRKTDVVVLGISFTCFIWICLYKLCWIVDTDLLFNNADRWADITYTVFTSIVASGIFYLVTIFIPKCTQINIMKKQIAFYLYGIDFICTEFIKRINVSGTSENYTIDSFYESVNNKTKKQKAKDDFIAFYGTPKLINIYVEQYKHIMQFVDCITLNYSNLLPQEIVRKLGNFKYLSFYILSLPQVTSTEQSEYYDRYYNILVEILNINFDLMKRYNPY